MKNKLIITIFMIVFLINLISAVPKIEPYVNDFAGTMNQDQIGTLNLLADKIEQNTTWEIAMVTVFDTEGLDRLDYANKLGDENGVGKKDKDNGIVILWSEGADRGIAIATGRYSESIFNDAKVGRIARAARPYFDNETYYEGFMNITLELQKEITDFNTQQVTPQDTPQDFTLLIVIVFVALGLIILVPLIRSGSSSFGDDYDSSSTGRRGFSIGSGSIGRSGGSFGGGSWGGGGAKG
jgi:uncharacterized protein